MNRECIYHVNEEKGVIVCEITDCEDDALDMLVSKGIGAFRSCYPEEFYLRDTYKGIARLHQGDTYNEEYGKKLAYGKAMVKYNRALAKKLRFIHKHYAKEMADLVKVFEEAENQATKREQNSLAKYAEIINEAK